MGAVASSNKAQQPEGEHFTQMLKPSVGKNQVSVAGGKRIKEKPQNVKISPRARIIKMIQCDLMWDNFLASASSSFALTPTEASAILLESLIASDVDSGFVDSKLASADVAAYIELIIELAEKEKDAVKGIDFLALCSSVLLLSPITIESKIDMMFLWIVLDEHRDRFNFDEFFVALTSFEKGLSHAMGKPACTEGHVRTVATQWFALADPQHRGNGDPHTEISSAAFFEFCTNRQMSVRKLLEALGASEVEVDHHSDMQEVVQLDLSDDIPPTGGDEFMANPAWKKTAERMIPKALVPDPSKPTASLTLEWVHGYRGFDCRNNVYYVNPSGSQITFTAAALGIVQVRCRV